jgi:UDP-N-acetylmuramoylalanine--D-glutamate ligase
VVEVSSFQLHYSDGFRPDVAVLTNVSPDHLDWHGTYDRYLEAKSHIVRHQRPEDLVVYCGDDPGASRIAERAFGRKLAVTSDGVSSHGYGIDRDTGRIQFGDWGIDIERLAVSETAFLIDLCLAAAAAAAVGGTADGIGEVATRFVPTSHRRTLVAEHGGVRFVDDSKATNPHAALAAIRDYPSVVLIAGGLAKGLDIGPLATEPNVRHVVAIGASADDLVVAGGSRVEVADTMDAAVTAAAASAGPGDVVLLAPGCASFDMFDSYGHRGDVFAAAVRDLFDGRESE